MAAKKGCRATGVDGSFYFSTRTLAAEWIKEKSGSKLSNATISKKISDAIKTSTIYENYMWFDEEWDCPRGYNIQQVAFDSPNAEFIAKRKQIKNHQLLDAIILEKLNEENSKIEKERQKAYEDSMGIYSMLYKILPQYKTKEDIIKDMNEDDNSYHIIVETNAGNVYADNIAEVAILLKENLTREEILEGIKTNSLHNKYFYVNPNYIQELLSYLGE